MLAVPADRLPAALGELDPGNRALLDLSLRRGVSDAEIGELLRKDPGDVARGREAVLELLADALDVSGHDRRERVRSAVVALPEEAWSGPRPRAEPEPEARPEPEAPVPQREPVPAAERTAAPEPGERTAAPGPGEEETAEHRPPREEFYFRPDPPRRGRGGLIAAIGLLVVIAAVAVLLLSGGDDDEPAPDSDRTGTEPAPSPGGPGGDEGDGEGAPDGERAVTLRPLAGERGQGRAIVARDGSIVVTVRGLPRAEGGYTAWLYDSIVEAVSLGTFEGPDGRVQVRLPAEAARYRFIDVSQEPPDGNPNHSGDSVLRAPLRDLLSRGD